MKTEWKTLAGKRSQIQSCQARAKTETLQKPLTSLKAQSAEYLDSLQRERASFANYKKRVDQDNRLVYENALADLIKIFLPVVDDLERALKNKPSDPEAEA